MKTYCVLFLLRVNINLDKRYLLFFNKSLWRKLAWPLLLTWFNFNTSMDKLSHAQ